MIGRRGDGVGNRVPPPQSVQRYICPVETVGKFHEEGLPLRREDKMGAVITKASMVANDMGSRKEDDATISYSR